MKIDNIEQFRGMLITLKSLHENDPFPNLRIQPPNLQDLLNCLEKFEGQLSQQDFQLIMTIASDPAFRYKTKSSVQINPHGASYQPSSAEDIEKQLEIILTEYCLHLGILTVKELEPLLNVVHADSKKAVILSLPELFYCLPRDRIKSRTFYVDFDSSDDAEVYLDIRIQLEKKGHTVILNPTKNTLETRLYNLYTGRNYSYGEFFFKHLIKTDKVAQMSPKMVRDLIYKDIKEKFIIDGEKPTLNSKIKTQISYKYIDLAKKMLDNDMRASGDTTRQILVSDIQSFAEYSPATDYQYLHLCTCFYSAKEKPFEHFIEPMNKYMLIKDLTIKDVQALDDNAMHDLSMDPLFTSSRDVFTPLLTAVFLARHLGVNKDSPFSLPTLYNTVSKVAGDNIELSQLATSKAMACKIVCEFSYVHTFNLSKIPEEFNPIITALNSQQVYMHVLKLTLAKAASEIYYRYTRAALKSLIKATDDYPIVQLNTIIQAIIHEANVMGKIGFPAESSASSLLGWLFGHSKALDSQLEVMAKSIVPYLARANSIYDNNVTAYQVNRPDFTRFAEPLEQAHFALKKNIFMGQDALGLLERLIVKIKSDCKQEQSLASALGCGGFG